MGKIPPSYLPARSLWPERVYTLPEHRSYPQRLNSTIAREPTGTVYWRDGEKQKQAVRDGWCRAGDFVTMDEDGYVWFLSREDDLIKSSGYRIGPEEIEDAVRRHPAAADCCVIGVSDPVRGQNTRAYVVLKPGVAAAEALRRELIESCRDHLAVYKLPREVEFMETATRAPGPAGPGTGKLLRRVLRDKLKKS